MCVCAKKVCVCVLLGPRAAFVFRSASLTRSSLNFLRQSLSVSWCFNVSRCLSASFCIFKDFYGSLVISMSLLSLQAAKLALREIQYITAEILRMLQTTSDGLDHPERSIICFPPEGFINNEGIVRRTWNVREAICAEWSIQTSAWPLQDSVKGNLRLWVTHDIWLEIITVKPKETVKSWWDTC